MPCDISGESQCTAFLTSFFIYLKKEKTGLLTGVGKTVHFNESSRIRGPFGALYLRIEGSGSHPRTHLLPLVMDIVWGGKIQKLCNTSHPYVYSCVATFFFKKCRQSQISRNLSKCINFLASASLPQVPPDFSRMSL